MPSSLLLLDVGNTRLKWGRLDSEGILVESLATPIDDRNSCREAIDRMVSDEVGGAAVASVNPPVADRLLSLLEERGIGPVRWFRSAADVPVRHLLQAPERTGADRALAVLAAIERAGSPGPGIVVQCGTAITVERIGPGGLWHGGAIAIGPGLASRALHAGTAQLPEVHSWLTLVPPQAWGTSSDSAISAGIVWGAVGAIRELIARQSEGLAPAHWVLWTGGDAPTLASLVCGDYVHVEPELVLHGMALAVGCRAGGRGHSTD